MDFYRAWEACVLNAENSCIFVVHSNGIIYAKIFQKWKRFQSLQATPPYCSAAQYEQISTLEQSKLRPQIHCGVLLQSRFSFAHLCCITPVCLWQKVSEGKLKWLLPPTGKPAGERGTLREKRVRQTLQTNELHYTGMATEQKDGKRYWWGDASVEETRAILKDSRFGSWQQVWKCRCLYIAQGRFRIITRWLHLVEEHCTGACMFHTCRKISWQCIHALVQSLLFPWGFRVH